MKKIALLAALFVLELLIVSTWLDGASLAGRDGLPGQIGIWGAWILRGIVVFCAAFLAFAGLQRALPLATAREVLESRGINWQWLGFHAAAAIAFGFLSAALYGNWEVGHPNILAIAWLLAGVLAIAFASAAFIPRAFLSFLRERTGNAWLYAAGVSLLAVASVKASQSLWQSTAKLTFELVRFLLRPVVPGLAADPARLYLRAPHFGVIIDQSCSGLEGVGLMLVFVSVWLILFRRDLRLPRSLMLLVAAPVVLYLLNAFRIAALLLIGNAGARAIAAGGFHSQAGWIAFNGVAFAMTIYVPRMDWFRRYPLDRSRRPGGVSENATAAYLLPFLAILAAGMLSRAASADFEWLYGLRLIAAVAVLWTSRKALRKVDWRFGWIGPTVGVVVFFIWIGMDDWRGAPSATMPLELSFGSRAGQLLWIVARVLAATTTVPIAEELAFRGFLMRRLQSPDFEAIPLSRASWTGVVLSSVAFGLLHGSRWVAGVIAGLLYAFAARRSNRLGEAVAAHATTNALLAIWVLTRQEWQYW